MAEPVAVIGMAALFPGSPDLHAFRQNNRLGVTAFSDAPADRIDPVFFDPNAGTLDRIYQRRGAFLGPLATFDALRHRVVPSTVDQAEPDQLLVLRLALDAVVDAGCALPDLPRARTGFWLGRGGYLTPGLMRGVQKVREGEQLLAVLRRTLPHLGEAEIEAVRAAWRASAGPLAPDEAIGLVPNLAASRTANRLDLQGPAMTVDGACASSLLAVEAAVSALRAGTVDAAFAGGVHLAHDPVFWSTFCQLGAMSRAGAIRPFDAEADGLLIGEGAGVVLLKRLGDAVRDGDRVRAVILGVGSASDGQGGTLMAPSVRGQVLALERAWADSGCEPGDVGLIEAHGTATAAGDAAELSTLAAVFGASRGFALGSVKALIGHTMPAAGIAGFIRAVLAVEDGVIPPAVGVRQANPGLGATRASLPASASAWAGRRIAGVNAFGFGGINAHVVLGQAPTGRRRPAAALSPGGVALYAAASASELADAVRADVRRGSGGPFRLALHDPTPARREMAAEIAGRGRPWQGRKGVWCAPAALTGRVALLFPGVEEAFDPGVASLADGLGLAVPPVLRDPVAPLDQLGPRGAQIVAAGRLTAAMLARVGLRPDVLVGHSVGEWTALVVGGVIPEGEIDAFVGSLRGESLALPDVVFGVFGGPVGRVREVLGDRADVVVSHDNAPHQTVLCGPDAAVRDVLAALGAPATILPFQSGFHTPFFAPFVRDFHRHLSRLPLTDARGTVWSSCTVGPYPPGADAVREVLRRHLIEPVRLSETVRRLHDEGVRTFVLAGGGSVAGLVGDILAGREHAVVSVAEARRSSVDALALATGALWALGHDVQIDAVPGVYGPRGKALRLGAPLLDPAVAEVEVEVRRVSAPGPVAEALARSLAAIGDAQADVMAALASRSAPTRSERRLRLGLSSHPFLIDHGLFPQPPEVTDPLLRFPVVPMTMLVQLMQEEAQHLVPGRVVIGVGEVRALRWLLVEPAVDVTIVAERQGPDRVAVRIEGYAEAVVTLGSSWPSSPAPRAAVVGQPVPVAVDAVYRDGWMFHGPAYQGISGLGPVAERAIGGTVRVPPAPGALLDNVGQVFGFWGFLKLGNDGLGFPSRIGQIRFFGPTPPAGATLDVRSAITNVTDSTFRGDIEVLHEGRVWARLDGWENRRFETDELLFPFLRQPGIYGLAEPLGTGRWRVRERWRTAASRELLVRRYLDRPGLAAWEAVPAWEKRAWALTRVAATDALRATLWARGAGPVFPVQAIVRPVGDGWVADGHGLVARVRLGEGYADVDVEDAG